MNKNILLCVSGGIAVYKAVALVSKLSQAGFQVKVIMTASARQFVNPLSFQVMSKNDVYYDTFDEKDSNVIAHIDLADWADLILVAPATANVIGKLANGIADDMVTTTLLATTAPVWLAPAMNVHMYEHPAVKRNLAQLAADGYQFIEPSEGFLACGYVGKGRLEEPEKITAIVVDYFSAQAKPLAGKTVLVTAGAWSIPFDNQHIISSKANGRIGQALAKEAQALGAHVILLDGDASDVNDMLAEVERLTKQYPQALLLHAATIPTIDNAPMLSIEGLTAVTFGQTVIGQPILQVVSDEWIDFSHTAKIKEQLVDVSDAHQFAQALWQYVLQGEAQ
ncbi:bifunctional phosphopantothenoylcysteine decarboxylase/phosphopantothenate--cysteine ligase CoaBC [Lysinibacillus sp. 38-6]|uniref:bifunctional phosphopantothenoylcysteine decarboxylase/phosphopantothenate--cysteine ligase CoaBC n=1 Tax=Lysinibacillus sp. 38-6 TaxID=3385991 RepID=UPI00390899EB